MAVTFLLYSPTLRFQFVYDDVQQIVENPNIQSWKYLPDYFTKHLWSQDGSYQVRFYRPFFLLWLRMNHALFGLKASYWHLTTVGAHLLATLLVYSLVLVLLRNWVPAAFSALFFGLHPIHVEVAAWISASSEALLAAALVGSLACYAKSQEKKDWRWLAGSMVFYAVGLLFKETAMVFPAVLFIFAWLWLDPRTGRTWVARTRAALLRTTPFVILTVVYLGVRWAVLKSIVTASAPMGLKTLILTLPSLLFFYGRLLLWPRGLSPLYDTPLVAQPNLANFFLPLLAVVAAGGTFAIFVWKTWKTTRERAHTEVCLVILACAWMIIFILPALNLRALQDGMFVQDRYLYVPSVGFSILLGLGLSHIGRGSRQLAGMPSTQVLLALVLAGMMAAVTFTQSKVWANNVALFTRAMERAPNNRMAYHELGASLLDSGRYQEAIKLLQESLRQDPNDFADNNNLGQAYLNLGDREHAEPFLAKSCQLRPTAKKLYQLGAVRFNLGRPEPAKQAFIQAIAMDPNGAGYHYALGLALERLGNWNQAIDAFQKELAVNPGDSGSRQELSRLTAGGRH